MSPNSALLLCEFSSMARAADELPQHRAESSRGSVLDQYQSWTLAGTNVFSTIGLQGQFIFVDPDTDTVVVKLSYFPPDNMDVERESIALLQAASKWNGH